MKNYKEILCTVGPSSTSEKVIKRLAALGISLFRINLSHTNYDEIEGMVDNIRKYTDVPICLDTEGAQVRIGKLKDKSIKVEMNDKILIERGIIEGDRKRFNLYPSYVVDELNIGDILSIDFNSVLVQVIEKNNNGVMIRVLTGGMLGQNKAVSVDRNIKLSSLTDKDRKIIELGLRIGIKHVALSFAGSGDDVEDIRSLVGKDVFVISKIESLDGIKNLDIIADCSNAILIDRGDLSRQVPVEQIPHAQKTIIRRAKQRGTKVYVATNLLESMIHSAVPTRAEVNDIFNTLVDGADGLVLAAETAVGDYPVQCAMMVNKIIRQFQHFSDGIKFDVEEIHNRNSLLLVAPHGGVLVDRLKLDYDEKEIGSYKKLLVDERTILDVEQLGLGTFSPLEGFMNEGDLRSVIDDCKLMNGLVWPLPITLQVDKDKASQLNVGDVVALVYEKDGEIYASIKIQDIYQFDPEVMAKEIFHTAEMNHPGVKYLKTHGEYFLGGKIELYRRLPSEDKYFEITPRQSRMIFDNNGWSRVVAFHTRNVVHRVHEHIQLLAFEKYHCDGLFIHPLAGPKKEGDYLFNIILKGYALIIDKYYPKQKVLLAAFQNYPRYSGPREAVFTAICRKNFGCSHFIVGRDHSGVGNYYEPDAAHRLFEKLGDIGIVPIFFNEFAYSKKKKAYVEVTADNENDILSISGTEGREMIKQNITPPDWFMREDLSNLIIHEMNNGAKVFQK